MPTLARVGDVVDVELMRAATGGAVGRVDGAVIFVRLGLPGERVRATVTEVARSFVRGVATEVVAPSTERVAPPCPYAEAFSCGGCDLQHATALAQRDWKRSVAEEHLRRIAGISVPVNVRSFGHGEGTRTRVRCAVADGRLGLRRWRSHEIVRLDHCWIADSRLAPAFSTDWGDVVDVELRAIGDGSPFAVVRRSDGRGALRDLENRPYDGAVSAVDVGDLNFRVSPTSFWQSHREAPDVLTERVVTHAAGSLSGNVIDLYGGVGLFGVALAHQNRRRHVTVVEESPDACADARHNGRSFENFNVVEGVVSARTVAAVVNPGDLVVLDPPRTGVHKSAITAVASARPARIIYVSCDAATLSRDISTLRVKQFELTQLEAFDLFPMTEHLELVAVLDDATL